jgi:hypothetical protein
MNVYGYQPIKRNKDGRRNLAALKQVIAKEGHEVFRQGGVFIIRRYCAEQNCYHQRPAPHWATWRDAAELALGLDLSRGQVQ